MLCLKAYQYSVEALNLGKWHIYYLTECDG